MEELYHAGKIRAIGVCNFLSDRLTDLILSHTVVPAVNQIELHPFCQQVELRQVMQQYQIQPMAWAPFAEGQNDIFQNPVLMEIGKKYHKTAAQVILCWLQQNEIIAIPKSVHAERIRENFQSTDFALSVEEQKQIENLDLHQSLILDLQSLEEVHRLHGIKFVQ